VLLASAGSQAGAVSNVIELGPTDCQIEIPSPCLPELYPKVGRGNGARSQLGQKSVQSEENPLPPSRGRARVGGQSIAVLTLNERPLPLTPPARGGASKH
jgi:hypothetical protein